MQRHTGVFFKYPLLTRKLLPPARGYKSAEAPFIKRHTLKTPEMSPRAGQGGNVFHDVVTIKNNSADEDFIMAGTYGDVFTTVSTSSSIAPKASCWHTPIPAL
jgi:hypothetical protein